MKKKFAGTLLFASLLSAGHLSAGSSSPHGQDETNAWLVKERFRGGYIWDSNDSEIETCIIKSADAGMTCLLLKEHWPHAQLKENSPLAKTILSRAAVAEKHHIRLFFVGDFTLEKEVRDGLVDIGGRYVSRDGDVMEKTPCPIDAGHWAKVMTDRVVFLAKLSISSKSIAGYALDAEMYSADFTEYSDICFDKKHNGVDQPQRIREIGESVKKAKDGINPSFLAGLLAPGLATENNFISRNIAAAIGTEAAPFLIFTETLYNVGYNNRRLFDTKSTHFKNAGHVLFIPGLSLHAGVAAPGYLQANLYNFAMEADGYWLWTMAALTQNIRGGSVGIQKDKTAAEYWTAIKEANDEINKKLSLGESYKTALTVKKPRPEWRKEDVRRILDMARNSKVFTDKPLDGGAEGTVFRGSQFVVVRVGDDKTLSFRLKSVPFYGYGAGFLIFNPEGEIVKDMIELQPGETRDFTFNDISSGLYALIIDGNIDAWEVRFDKNPRAFVSLSSFNTTSADKCVPGRHFFYVPTGVGVFSAKFKIRSPYRKHGDYTVRMSPLGSGAWRERKLDEKQKVAGGVMDINVNVAENEDGKIWEVDYSPAWGVSFLFGSMIPPFIGDSPSKMLIPAN